jgi:hypothetical protein
MFATGDFQATLVVMKDGRIGGNPGDKTVKSKSCPGKGTLWLLPNLRMTGDDPMQIDRMW